MDTVHHITRIARAAATRWRWLIECWSLRLDVHDTITRLVADREEHRDKAHLLQIEADDLRARLKEYLAEHQQAKDGNRALLRWIYTRHRLNMKLDSDTIRAALNNGIK